MCVAFAAPAGSIGGQSLISACRTVLRGEKKTRARVDIIVVDDAFIAALHRRFFNEDGPTDVMTFPLEEGGRIEAEVYISIDTARVQAREYGVSIREEMTRLVVHGTLHACGYDDRTEPSRRAMKQKEELYVRKSLRRRRTPG
ncbi:MAG: rRNA maturation RNase YbeY [Bacteroidota bacterium]|nr:rRNA maturation RNase YbeY [Bacteroidota bacterium]